MQISRTIVAHGRLAMREVALRAARDRAHGVRVLTFERLIARLAGGFACPIDNETLLTTVRAALASTDLGALDDIKALPGMAHASAETLRKAWRAGIDLAGRAHEHPRLGSIATLENAVRERLPAGMLRPGDLVSRAMSRIEHARTVFGSIEVIGITELSPVWRPLLRALADRLPVTWNAGPRNIPAWLDGSAISIVRDEPHSPEIVAVSASTALHEAIEAVRWARELLATGRAEPQDIAFTATSPDDYDDHLMVLRADANIPIHFVHGVKAIATREGQATAALADVLVRGLSQNRVRRLARLVRGSHSPFEALPEDWTRILPREAPLRSVDSWKRTLAGSTPETWSDGINHMSDLLRSIELLNGGTEIAAEAGEAFLSGRSLTIWRTALVNGSPSAVDTAIESMRLDDSLDACVSIAWMPAASLAASPRKFVRLVGLTSRGWPRQVSEDRLLSDHIIPTSELDPLPVSAADRRDFETILLTTETQVVVSRARRDAEGRLLGKSPLLHELHNEVYLARTRTPPHAMSETDRLLARPQEFTEAVQARSTATCWHNWAIPSVTAHDGLVRENHPAIEMILARVQSASSLRKLLRDPLGFVWRYGLGMRAPELEEEPLVLDPAAFGDLVHSLLERAVRLIETRDGLSAVSTAAVETAIGEIGADVQREWESRQATPPTVIWQRTLAEARALAAAALLHRDDPLDGQRSFAEVPFGSSTPSCKTDHLPWDPSIPVQIAGTELRINGLIDRIDVSADGRLARVRDYKTGRTPSSAIILDGGKELQRCLYAFAVKALLGDQVTVDASLLYPRDGTLLRMDQPDVVLAGLRGHLAAARTSLLAGRLLAGPDTSGDYNDLSFALPANGSKTYCIRKEPSIALLLGPAAAVWEAP